MNRREKLGEFTYGLEIEWSDCDSRTPLPEDCGKWSPKEWTIVNSDGRANDPTNIRNTQGGEINTVPSDTIERQVEITRTLRDLLNPTALYRGSLQVHIGVPGLVEDLDALKDLFRYTIDNQPYIFFNIFPRVKLTKGMFSSEEDWKVASRYDRQKNLWTKRGVAASRINDILAAETTSDFYENHFQYNEKLGRRLYHLGVWRAGVNVRAAFQHGTVEFRCFPNTVDPDQVRDCLEFARQIVEAGLYNPSRTAEDIYKSREWNFPDWPPFNVELEKGFHATAKRPDGI